VSYAPGPWGRVPAESHRWVGTSWLQAVRVFAPQATKWHGAAWQPPHTRSQGGKPRYRCGSRVFALALSALTVPQTVQTYTPRHRFFASTTGGVN
jgi:hypothetical protein